MITDIKSLYGKRILLYGLGSYGVYVYNRIKANPKIKIEFLVDDFKNGQFIDNKKIVSFDEVSSSVTSYDIIIITTSYYSTILEKLKKHNLKGVFFDVLRGPSEREITIFNFNNKEVNFFTPNLLTQLSVENLNSTEPSTLKWIEGFKPNKCFFDIGASNGCYGLLASASKKIESYLIEPDNQNFNLISKNIKFNQSILLGEILPMCLALDAKNGSLTLNKLEDYEGAHSKVLEKYFRKDFEKIIFEGKQKVLTYSLDDLILSHKLTNPNYIKIDVDGAEFSVLEGAKITLSSDSLEEILIETEEMNEMKLNQILLKFGFNLSEKHSINEIMGGKINGTHNYLFSK